MTHPLRLLAFRLLLCLGIAPAAFAADRAATGAIEGRVFDEGRGE